MCPAVPITTGRMTPSTLASDAADRGSEPLELLLDPFVAAVEVVDAGDPRLALGHEAGQDERRGGPEVGRHDGGPAQRRHALDRRRVPLHANVRPQTLELGHVREAV